MAEVKVNISEKLWSQICDEADAEKEDDTEYRFSNGRKFVSEK